jgi:hypothetical protein
VIWLRWSYLPGTQPLVNGEAWMLDTVSVVDVPLVDSDGDGFTDDVDLCPTVAGTVNGCPADTDADGFTDDVDVCPLEAGIGTADGCPVVTPVTTDTDGDGFTDDVDACVTVPGAANGCPDDLDGDGITDAPDSSRNKQRLPSGYRRRYLRR